MFAVTGIVAAALMVAAGVVYSDGETRTLTPIPSTSSTTSAPSAPKPEQSVPIADGSLGSLTNDAPAPVKLRIPSISVNAAVVPAGLTSNGAEMEVPELDTVGWYRYGSKPGESGSTLLAGHVDGDGRRGVFWSLRNVKQNDTVEVSTGAKTQQYRVSSVMRVTKTELPADVFRRDGDPVLTLITCGGRFDRASGHYVDNVVVVAVPV